MLHGDGDNEEHGFCPVGQFILQNLGLLFGFAIMLVIALYEDKIVFDLQFWPFPAITADYKNVTMQLCICSLYCKHIAQRKVSGLHYLQVHRFEPDHKDRCSVLFSLHEGVF